MTPTTIYCGIYCRISQDREGRRLGVERQEEDCRALAVRNGWEIFAIYTDNDITAAKLPGKTEKARPEYDRMVTDIKSGKLQAIVSYSQARLTRKGTIEDLIDLCEANSVNHVAIVTGSDINPTGNLVTARVQAAVDAEYVRKLSEDGKRAKKQAKARGQWTGGGRPYGYQIHKASTHVPSVLVRDDVEAEHIRRWAKAVLAGRSLSAIANDMTTEGVPSTRGAPWAHQTLRGILTNRHYLAEAPAQWDAILDVDTFNAVGAILSDPTRRPKPLGQRYPLVGVLVCHCGARMVSRPTTNHQGQSVRRYACRTTGHGGISADHVETYVFDKIARLADLPRVGQIIQQAEGHADDEAAALRVAIAEDGAAVADLLAGVGNGVKFAQVQPQVAALNARIAQREAQLAERAGRSALDKYAGRVVADWETLDVEDQRSVILSLVRGVVVKPSTTRYGWHPERLVPNWRVQLLGTIKWPEPTEADLAEQQRLSDEEDLAQLRADNAEADEAEHALRGDAA